MLYMCAFVWQSVACHAVTEEAELYLSIFSVSVQGRGSAGNHRGTLSQRCNRNQ